MLGFIAILVLLVLVIHYFFKSYHLKSSLDILLTELRKTESELRKTESELTDVKKALSFSDMKVRKDSQGRGDIVGVNRTTRKPIIQPRMPVSSRKTIRSHPSPEIFGGISGQDSGSSSSSSSSDSSSSSSNNRDTSSSNSSYSGGGGGFSGGGSGGDW